MSEMLVDGRKFRISARQECPPENSRSMLGESKLSGFANPLAEQTEFSRQSVTQAGALLQSLDGLIGIRGGHQATSVWLGCREAEIFQGVLRGTRCAASTYSKYQVRF